MGKAKISDAETVIHILQDEIHRFYQSCYDHRLHAMLLGAQGMICPKVSDAEGLRGTVPGPFGLRVVAAEEALQLGSGGISVVSPACGLP